MTDLRWACSHVHGQLGGWLRPISDSLAYQLLDWLLAEVTSHRLSSSRRLARARIWYSFALPYSMGQNKSRPVQIQEVENKFYLLKGGVAKLH